MLRAYLDDSGSDGSAVLAIGGGISKVEAWEEFEHELRCLLSLHSLQTLHMSELGWNEQDVGPIVRGAFSLVDRYVECYVGCSVRDADPNLKRYLDAGLACVMAVIDLTTERWPNERVEIVFEQTKGLTGTIVDTIKNSLGQKEWEHVADIRMETKNEIVLGAADLIASTYRVVAETDRQQMDRLLSLKKWAVEKLQKKPCKMLFAA
jgi:hypothetical protein